MRYVAIRLIMVSAAAAVFSGCNIPIDIGGAEVHGGYGSPGSGDPFPATTRAVVGFPWEKVDLTSTDQYGNYVGRLEIGDSVVLSYRQRAGSSVPIDQLLPAKVERWRVEGAPIASAGSSLDTLAASVRPTAADGEVVLKANKPGFWISVTPYDQYIPLTSTVYACHDAQCVRVTIMTTFAAGGTSTPSTPSTPLVYTRAVIGVPWDKVDFRFRDPDWGYAAVFKAGDSITLFYVQGAASTPSSINQLQVVPTDRWTINAQSMEKPGTMDSTAASIRADRTSGGAVVTFRKAGYWVYAKPDVGVVFYENYLYSCRQNECVKVFLAVPTA